MASISRSGDKQRLLRSCAVSKDQEGPTSEDSLPITSVLFHVSFDGGRFNGWSSASSDGDQEVTSGPSRTVQGTIRNRLSKIFGNVDEQRIVVEGTNPTEKGEHASKMIAQIYCLTEKCPEDHPRRRPQCAQDDEYFVPFPMPPSKLRYVLNRILPDDIRIRRICPSPDYENTFHPSRHAVTTTFEYTLSIGKAHLHDPTQWRRTWHLDETNFDISSLKQACELLEGRHAIRSLERLHCEDGEDEKSATISTINVTEAASSNNYFFNNVRVYTISISGNGFLHKVVRSIVSAIVQVGQGELSLPELDMISSQEHSKQDPGAPPNGLVLANVIYDSNLDWYEI